MRNILNSQARTRGKRELRAVFKALRYKDGLTIEQEGMQVKTDYFVYYYNKARDGQMGNYIVYEVVASDPTQRADDKVIGREFYAQVDVFQQAVLKANCLQKHLRS